MWRERMKYNFREALKMKKYFQKIDADSFCLQTDKRK